MLELVTADTQRDHARRSAMSYAATRANDTGKRRYVFEVTTGYVVCKRGDKAPKGAALIYVADPEV